jgi:hypothetical protein
MNPMVNTILVLEKELELERQGLRRTRRYIGDLSQVTDARWYQGEVSQVAEAGPYFGEVSRVAEVKPRWEAHRSILVRLFHMPRTRRQPACDEC